jgi:hypothetical protein
VAADADARAGHGRTCVGVAARPPPRSYLFGTCFMRSQSFSNIARDKPAEHEYENSKLKRTCRPCFDNSLKLELLRHCHDY